MLAAAVLLTSPRLLDASPLQDEEPVVRQQRRVVVEIDERGGQPQVIFVGEHGGPVRVEALAGRGGHLGVQLLEITPELRRHFGAPADRGLLLARVVPGGPADLAGLEVGDLLMALDGHPARSSRDAARRIWRREAGDRVELTVIRAGSELSLSATLDEAERPQVDLATLFAHCPEGEECAGAHFGPSFRRVFPIDPEQLHESMESLNEHLESPEWRDRILRFKSGYEGLEARIRELEQQIDRLRQQLDESGD